MVTAIKEKVHKWNSQVEGDKYIFQRDVIFNTTSPAAAILYYQYIGPQNWKNDVEKH